MLKALKTLINSPSEQDNHLGYMETSPAISPKHSDSRSIFALSSKSARKPSRTPRANSIENVLVEEVGETKQEFDFETFHKNINQQKAKSVKVKETWS